MTEGTARRPDAIRLAAGALAAVFVAMRLLRIGLPLGRYVVDGPSMEPAYCAGDRVLVNRLAYVRRAPAAGDVVVLRDPERRGRHLLKRIATPPEGAIVGKDRYFVLGDNAGVSRDSRAFGPVRRRDVVGRAWRKY
ncbi:MAG: S26 family signal peptidase [Chloroflexota bacterium]|nr:S26 family signal peptidase [Chloroflexota bacterium]